MPTFPSYDVTGRLPARFRALPRDWKEITEEFQYEDAGKDFNEVSDNAPKRWEYGLTGLTQSEADYYDAFFNSVRFVIPFDFTDKWGTTWSNVFIETYDRNHDAHKSWVHSVTFGLVGYDSEIVEAPAVPTGFHVVSTTETTVTLDWDPTPEDVTFGGVDVVYGGEQVYYQAPA